jgi:hypothetical protein
MRVIGCGIYSQPRHENSARAELMRAAPSRTITIIRSPHPRGRMPVTAKLSRRFYEQFGDELANELVDWLNAVDATYRSDLRELNELNFARFDAKLEQRFAEQDAKWEKRAAERDAQWAKDTAERDARWAKSIAERDARWAKDTAERDARWENTVSELDAKWERRFGEFGDALNALKLDLVRFKLDLVRWMFAFWTGTLLALAAFLFAVLRSR